MPSSSQTARRLHESNMHATILQSEMMLMQTSQFGRIRQGLPAGRMQHYIKTGEHAKGQPARSTIAHGPGPGLQHCSLTILEVLLVTLPAAAAASADWQPDACESLLELETGRTHQVS